MNRIVLASFAIGAAGIGISHATYARVESMGKNTAYIMDDISIFDNPANMNIYPNYLIGEMGLFTNNLKAGDNQDPQNPWYGGIFSLGLGSEDSRDPRISIGGALNRKDERLYSFLPDSVFWMSGLGDTSRVAVPSPVTNFDGFLGFSTPAGNMVGSHIYIAHQDGGEYNSATGAYQSNVNAFASILKADVGVNWQLSEQIDGELALGTTRIQYGPDDHGIFDGDLFSVLASGRLFSTIEAINGELVPSVSFANTKAPGIEDNSLRAGVGVNVALDRGFFWLGFDYLYSETRSYGWTYNQVTGNRSFIEFAKKDWDVRSSQGGQVSFGIERNIWWEWFVIRVGGKKVIQYIDCEKNSSLKNSLCPDNGNYWSTNPMGDGTMNDQVGFGFGINVEEKLKIDATAAEDVLYRNPFQGSGRLLSRVSATYSF